MNIKTSFKNQIIALLFLTSTALLFSRCKKDSLEETQLDATTSSALTETIQSNAVAADGITSNSYYLENALPSGYVKDGSRDYTSYIQAAVNKYSNLVFPGFPIQINNKGILIGSNKTITFKEGSELRLKGSSASTYNLLHMYKVSNVVLYNPVIVGDRNSHIGTEGEFGTGIAIRSSSNITIYNPKVTYCWGDGIYIGQADTKEVCKNIVIKDAYLYKNRRDGISIISVDGLQIDNIYAGYTDGTKPWAGINFEPNNPQCELKNIRINNPVTENNGANGIQIIPYHMIGSTNKTADITIVNHIDRNSPRYAVKMFCNPPSTTIGKLYATINLVNPTWHKTGTNVPLVLSTNQANIKTVVSSPEVMNTSGTILSWTATYDLLMKQLRSGSISVSNLIDPAFTTIIGTDPAETVEQSPVTVSPAVVFAVNAGGTSFKASNGITYSADKSYSGGSLYKTGNSISNTSDDALYQTERYGKTFSYSIPVTDGTYEITFKTSENYHKASGKRKFDILAEGKELIADMDIYSVAGFNGAYDVIKTVTVTDGTLNLNFRTDLDQAKIAAFHVIKK